LLPGLRLCFGSCSRFWQELLEVSEEIRRGLEKMSDLTVHVLDWLRLALVSLEDFEELLVNVRLRGKSVLPGKLAVETQLLLVKEKLTLILFT